MSVRFIWTHWCFKWSIDVPLSSHKQDEIFACKWQKILTITVRIYPRFVSPKIFTSPKFWSRQVIIGLQVNARKQQLHSFFKCPPNYSHPWRHTNVPTPVDLPFTLLELLSNRVIHLDNTHTEYTHRNNPAILLHVVHTCMICTRVIWMNGRCEGGYRARAITHQLTHLWIITNHIMHT